MQTLDSVSLTLCRQLTLPICNNSSRGTCTRCTILRPSPRSTKPHLDSSVQKSLSCDDACFSRIPHGHSPTLSLHRVEPHRHRRPVLCETCEMLVHGLLFMMPRLEWLHLIKWRALSWLMSLGYRRHQSSSGSLSTLSLVSRLYPPLRWPHRGSHNRPSLAQQ